MKTIITGSRSITSYAAVCRAVEDSAFDITEVVSGAVRGVDQLGERYANEHGIPIKRFPAKWDEYGKRAGYLRNEEMAVYANAVILLWDGESKGTRHMWQLAIKHGLKVFVDF